MKKEFYFMIGIIVLSIIILSGKKVLIQAETNSGEVPLGCIPDGSVFENFVPNAVKLREINYVTDFGTLNTNIVVGKKISGKIACAVSELTERMGEFLANMNTSALLANIVMIDEKVPEKYLKERTIILCGISEENKLIKQLVQKGKSKVDWTKAKSGTIEIIEKAFDGFATAVIAGGADEDSSYVAIGALAGFFTHIAGANLGEDGLLSADQELKQGDVKGAARSIERLINGLRLDGSAKIFVPVKNITPDFMNLLQDESRQASNLLKILKENPPIEKAEDEFKKLAGFCFYCHQKYVSYDRMNQNRVKFHYSQYPDTRCETEWVNVYKEKKQ